MRWRRQAGALGWQARLGQSPGVRKFDALIEADNHASRGVDHTLCLQSARMFTDFFAGIPVTVYATAVTWYERLFGSPPSFLPTETEAVWELAEHRFAYIEQRPEHAGHAMHTIFVDDLDALVAQIADRVTHPRAARNVPERRLQGHVPRSRWQRIRVRRRLVGVGGRPTKAQVASSR